MFANDVAASGFKPTRRILQHGAFPTQVDASGANTTGVAVRKRHAGKSKSDAVEDRRGALHKKREAAQVRHWFCPCVRILV